MASGDYLPVDCGYRKDGSTYILTYTMTNVDKKTVNWRWESAGESFIARVEGKSSRGDIKFHKSEPIDGSTHSQLGRAKTSMDGDFFRVKLKWKGKSSNMPDLQSYFIKQ